MVQKSSVKKDALLPWSQRGRVGGRARVFTPSPQSPPLLPQLPGGKRKGNSYTKMQVSTIMPGAFQCGLGSTGLKKKPTNF